MIGTYLTFNFFLALWFLIALYISLIENIGLSVLYHVESIKETGTACNAPFWFWCDQSHTYPNLQNKAW